MILIHWSCYRGTGSWDRTGAGGQNLPDGSSGNHQNPSVHEGSAGPRSTGQNRHRTVPPVRFLPAPASAKLTVPPAIQGVLPAVPVFFGLPKLENQFPPLLRIVGTTAILSTLFTVVGHPHKPIFAGKGGFLRTLVYTPDWDCRKDRPKRCVDDIKDARKRSICYICFCHFLWTMSCNIGQ